MKAVILRTRRALPLAALVCSLVALAACSSEADETNRANPVTAPPVFSPEERRIAQALSLGVRDIGGSVSSQDKALLCSLSLDALASRLEGSDVLTSEQQRAFAQAEAIFRRRGTTGRSPDAIRAARAALEEGYPEVSTRSRIALGCLRDLI